MDGLLIAFEGVDGAGNTTQSRLLASWLKRRGFKVVLTKEPTYGPFGKLIRKRLKTHSMDSLVDTLLFALDRAEHVVKVIKPSLEGGAIVVTDRYMESSIAYQGAQGVDLKWIEAVNSFAPKPSLTIVLDVEPALALSRKVRAKTVFEEVGFLMKVREILLKRALEKGYVIVDASKGIKEVQERVKGAVKLLLKART